MEETEAATNRDRNAAWLLAAAGFGATAVSVALPQIYPHFPWWLSALILWVGATVVGISIIEALHLYRSFDRVITIIIDLCMAILLGAMVYYLKPSIVGPCSAPLEVESLGAVLFNINHEFTTTAKPKVKIWVEIGRKDSCPYAKALDTAFRIGGWAPEPIMEDKLIGNGVWLHGSAGDTEIVKVYEQLWRSQPLKLALDTSSNRPSEEWVFWIKDTWPTPIQTNELTK
jgi:hypothetical protein